VLKEFITDNELLIATGNRGKFSEISQPLSHLAIKCLPAYDFIIKEPEEDGETFAQNALLKARYYAKKTNIVALADDSGICVADLDNNPGIHSARYAVNPQSQKRDFPFAFDKLYSELKEKGVQPESRPKAFFMCNLAIFDPKTNFSINFEGRVDGYLTFPARGFKGFGYDPIFIKNGMSETFAEIDPSLKDEISHRFIAMSKLLKFLDQKK